MLELVPFSGDAQVSQDSNHSEYRRRRPDFFTCTFQAGLLLQQSFWTAQQQLKSIYLLNAMLQSEISPRCPS